MRYRPTSPERGQLRVLTASAQLQHKPELVPPVLALVCVNIRILRGAVEAITHSLPPKSRETIPEQRHDRRSILMSASFNMPGGHLPRSLFSALRVVFTYGENDSLARIHRRVVVSLPERG